MWFLASLVTTFSAVLLYGKTERISEEAAIVCVAVGLVGLTLSLLAAPWQVQLLLLIAALASYRFTKTRLFG